IVHRDLKPENVYLESRPGNPEFVKILDFGIAKVMRGDTIDPQSPQLTATGQTLGTLEYMSPEQLMGKPLDGRSDVYALGVVAYEMITGRLPFPDAKGPAGLITAQLKQTPIPPSHANPAAGIPPAADRVILKCLEKDKNNRHADVSQLAVALQEVVAQAGAEAALSAGQSGLVRRPATPEVFDEPSASMMQMPMQGTHAMGHAGHPMSAMPGAPGAMPGAMPGTMPGQMPGPMGPGPMSMPGPMAGMPGVHAMGHAGHGAMSTAVGHAGHDHADPRIPTPPPVGGLSYASNLGGAAAMPQMYAQAPAYPPPYAPQTQVVSTTRWIWWIVALLALGAAVGAVLALAMR
ncbi:MAG: serine/threonine-protein kinase, partial [Kofleriaceae bacterium]